MKFKKKFINFVLIKLIIKFINIYKNYLFIFFFCKNSFFNNFRKILTQFIIFYLKKFLFLFFSTNIFA